MSGTTGFRFDDFEAHVAKGVLRWGGFRVRLQDLPFRLLVALAECPGEVVTRDELRKGPRAHGVLPRLRAPAGRGAQPAS